MTTELTRREMLKTAGIGALAFGLGGCSAVAAPAAPAAVVPKAYEQAPLPYGYGDLEPVLSEEILRLHHGRHHAAYVNGLNRTLQRLEAARAAGDMSLITALSRDLAFHGSGHVLHALYWESMAPGGTPGPGGALRQAINRDFGSVAAFKAQFAAASKAGEASAWGVLCYEPMGGRLLVMQAEKHQNLTIWGVVPLLVCDVWEHAYYLQYKADRGAYVDAFMEIIDWRAAERRFAQI